MRYWWVNQNQTYKHEIAGGYLWSPKRNKNGNVNPFYEFMREVAPGDLVLSFAGSHIRAIGTATSYAYECPKPDEFGAVGDSWNQIGWKVDCNFREFSNPIRPKEHIGQLARHLPIKYAPLQKNGDGLQGVYLTEISFAFAQAIGELVGNELKFLIRGSEQQEQTLFRDSAKSILEWEDKIRARITSDTAIGETEKQAIVMARRGQGKFKENVLEFEKRCRVTKVDRIEHLRASHCKPWRDSTNEERLSGENGLLLTPTIDHLFDRGFISFEDNGDLLISPVAHKLSLNRMGVRTGELVNVGKFAAAQKKYLDYHRNAVFLEAQVSRR